ncbi:ATP-binding cassette domain-containing protein [Modestobacter versicolor]|uniref:ATP-binding cassette domain-containing protein n=1 Tax=Modestobacter versicolor TaxID=429133 RepID=UPI0034DE22AF
MTGDGVTGDGVTGDGVTAPLLAAEGVCYSHPAASGTPSRRAVDDVSLELSAGEVVGVVGESGSGKSTLARTLVRLLRPEAGTVRYRGEDVAGLRGDRLRAYRRDVQMVFQDPYSSLNPRMTVEEIVGEGLVVHERGLDRAGRRERSVTALAEVGLDADVLDRHPRAFSGGQRQRIAIARALVLRPAALICDEPVSALDVSVQAQVVQLLRETQRRHDLAVLFIAHDLAVVRSLCSRVAVMHDGRVVESGSRDAVYLRPTQDYTRSLLAAVPVPDPPRERARRAAARAAAQAAQPAAGGPVEDR